MPTDISDQLYQRNRPTKLWGGSDTRANELTVLRFSWREIFEKHTIPINFLLPSNVKQNGSYADQFNVRMVSDELLQTDP